MRNGTLRYRQPSYKSHGVRYPLAVAQLGFQRARTEENKRQRAAALVEAARSLALETGVASVTLTAVAGRAGIHYSAVRRYFTSHKEVLLHLAAEGWARWSGTVCEQLGEPGPMSAPRVAEALANGLAADPLFCDLLANLHLHLEQEVDVDRVIEVKRTSSSRDSARRRDRKRIAGTRAFWGIRHPAGRLLAGGHPVADRQSAGAAHRRLCRGARVAPTGVEPRLCCRAYSPAHRYASRPARRIPMRMPVANALKRVRDEGGAGLGPAWRR